MKKALKSLLITILVAVVAAGGFYVYKGMERAKVLEEQFPLEQLVEQVETSPSYVPYDQIDPFLLEATVAVEDARFYDHNGLDWIGLIRAGLSQIVPVFGKSGGSTITQQVVKNLYGQYDQGLDWKIPEMFLALQLEKGLDKNEILTLYVNIINYGDGYTGINEASWGYFGVAPIDLSDWQASLLVGIPQSPANLQLSDHYEQALSKQRVVLEAMVRNKMISSEQADEIESESVTAY